MLINDIKVTERARTQMGFLDPLERSIEYRGLLQPVGVTEDGVLLFGARRLQACKNLGWLDIPARVIKISANDPAANLKIERDENDVRKDFTASEKVVIAQRIEEALSGRVGGDRGNQYTGGKVQTFASCQEPGKTRDLAAQSVGWSGEQYRQAKKVVESDDAETKEAMDSGELSVNRAYKKVTGKRKLSLTVHLAYEIQSDANALISKAGGEYATSLALEILRIEGHEVKHEQ